MKTGISFAPFFLIIIFFAACDKEDVKLCDAEEYLGKFELLPGSEQVIPYSDSMNIVFQNPDNEEITLKSFTRKTNVGWTVTGPCPYYESLWIKKKYDYMGKKATLSNDSMRFHLNINLVPISIENRLTPEESDQLKFELFDNVETSRYYTVFSLSIKDKLILDAKNANFFPTWEPFGRSFQNVYRGEIEIKGQKIDLFYNTEIGLAGFTDFEGNFWMFDRVE